MLSPLWETTAHPSFVVDGVTRNEFNAHCSAPSVGLVLVARPIYCRANVDTLPKPLGNHRSSRAAVANDRLIWSNLIDPARPGPTTG